MKFDIHYEEKTGQLMLSKKTSPSTCHAILLSKSQTKQLIRWCAAKSQELADRKSADQKCRR